MTGEATTSMMVSPWGQSASVLQPSRVSTRRSRRRSRDRFLPPKNQRFDRLTNLMIKHWEFKHQIEDFFGPKLGVSAKLGFMPAHTDIRKSDGLDLQNSCAWRSGRTTSLNAGFARKDGLKCIGTFHAVLYPFNAQHVQCAVYDLLLLIIVKHYQSRSV